LSNFAAQNFVEPVMNIDVVKSKIHRVRITGSDLNYIGSITIDEDLMDAANIIEGEKVHIVNINNGERLITYAIKGARKSGDIVLNGPAARRVAKDDIIIIISYASMDFEAAKSFEPSIVFPNEEDNSLT
jgi:aspartate 1-decarboxylase